MSDRESDVPNLIDRSVKRLFRDQPQALLRLAGVQEVATRFEDTSLNIPELHADHVFIVEDADSQQPYALYLEYQLKPDPELLAHWGLKWLGLCRQLPMEVVLLVIYLEKGKRASFPAAYRRRGGRLRTQFTFDTVRLWEHRDRIVSGEWPELAPLLVLCEAQPTEATLRQEVELIRQSGLPGGVQRELIGVAVSVASRRFGRAVLEAIFGEELAMLDEEENLKELFLDLGLAQKWAKDPRVSGELRAEAKAEGEALGMAKGRAEGQTEGETAAVRRMTLSFLTRRFGELPEALITQIATSDAEWCQSLFDRAIAAASLSELADKLSGTN
jgi:predicted transposase YdaD